MSYKSSTKILGEKRQLSNREISPVENKKIYVENPEENCIVKKGEKLYINSSKNEIEIYSIILSIRNGMIYKGIDHQRKRYAIKITVFVEDSPDSRTIDSISKLDSSKKLHFVNYYTYFTCNSVKEIISDNKIIIASAKNIAFKQKHIISIMDLYNYDNNLIINMYDDKFNHYHKKNIFTQFIISILSFHIFTNRLHLDVQIGNFFIEVLSKSGKITEPKHYQYRKPIQYISYYIYGELIYLENIDLNVIIGDYELSIDYNDNINAVNNYREDYHTIINIGIENDFFKILNKDIKEKIKDVNSFEGNEKEYIELLMNNTDIFAYKKHGTHRNSTKPFFIS